MKAMVYDRYGPPEVVQLEEMAQPVPKEGEVLIRIRAAAVTSADHAARSGAPFYARFAFGLTRPKYRILGSELAGDVAAVGKGVTRFKEGDAVFAATGDDFGAHAELICLPEDGAVALKPSNLSHEEAVAVSEGGLTALPFLTDWGELKAGGSVLVNGASGAVGTSAVQLARHLGAEVTGVCSTAKMELVGELGAHRVVDYSKEDFTGATGAYDVVFDAVGKSSFGRSRRSLKEGGIYLTTVPSLSILVHMPWTSRIGSRRARIGFAGLRQAAEKARDLDYLRELAEAGEVRPVLDGSYPLEEAVQAHRRVDTGHKTGTVVLAMP